MVSYEPLVALTGLVKQLYISNKQSASVIKVGVSRHLKEELAQAIDRQFQFISYLKQLYH